MFCDPFGIVGFNVKLKKTPKVLKKAKKLEPTKPLIRTPWLVK